VNELIPTHTDIVNLQHIIWEMKLNKWLHEDVFSWRWWTILMVMIASILIWGRVVDKKRLASIVMFGLIVIVLIVILDIVGYEMALWSYPVELLIMVPLLEIDFGMLPIIYLLNFQYFTDWKKFIIANIGVAVIFSFVLEPILLWAGFYEVHKWKSIYSLPIYLLIPILAKWWTHTVFKIQYRNSSDFDKIL
jgi:hypothetical protein